MNDITRYNLFDPAVCVNKARELSSHCPTQRSQKVTRHFYFQQIIRQLFYISVTFYSWKCAVHSTIINPPLAALGTIEFGTGYNVVSFVSRKTACNGAKARTRWGTRYDISFRTLLYVHGNTELTCYTYHPEPGERTHTNNNTCVPRSGPSAKT